MIENLIYHTVIIIFIVILLIYTIHLKSTYTIYKENLVPFLLKKEFKFPQDRSTFVRGISSLEKELTRKFEIKTIILFNKSKTHFYSEDFKVLFDVLNAPHSSLLLGERLDLNSAKQISFQFKNNATSDQSQNKLHSSWEVHIK